MNQTRAADTDIVLVGAGIMSATLAVFLKELEPSLRIEIFETLEGAALESSDAWNNAGTGHAALCELNYTPRAQRRQHRYLEGTHRQCRVRSLPPILELFDPKEGASRRPICSFTRCRI